MDRSTYPTRRQGTRRLAPSVLGAFACALAVAGCAGGAGPGPVAPVADEAPDVSVLEPVEGRSFAVYTGAGAAVSFEALLAAAADADVVLLGEEHDDAMTHRLQLEVLRQAFVRRGHGRGGAPGAERPEGHPPPSAAPRSGERRPVVLSLEMFERDVQPVLDEYLAGLVTEEHFLAAARPWRNYRTDYRPLVEFARAHGIPVVAANAPRRYVNRVSRLGRSSLEELSFGARETLPPLPYPGPSERYRAQWDSLMAGGEAHGSAVPESALDAQALWDAAMAHSIARALYRRPGALVIHLAGSFHVERGTGIPEALRRYRPDARVVSVVFAAEDDVGRFDAATHLGYGEFVVLTETGIGGGG